MPPKWQRWKNIMKCYPFEEKRLNKWSPPYIVQIKYDGDRARDISLDNKEHLIVSSEENIFYCLPHINEALKQLDAPFPLDGELYNHNLCLEGGHELIHSICSRSINIHPRYKEMEFHIFDYQDLGITSQTQRIIILQDLSQRIKPPLVLAPFWLCYTLDEIKKAYDDIVKLGYEGIIIRNIHAPYAMKRSTWVMKFKPKKKDVYRIVGWKEEVTKEGIPKGRIGSLIMSSQQGDEFGVSAGLDDEERSKLWDERDKLAGKDAIVHYQHLTNKKIPKGTFDIEIID